jgi:hypothetical protein
LILTYLNDALQPMQEADIALCYINKQHLQLYNTNSNKKKVHAIYKYKYTLLPQ